jgi:hypothetical protein
VLRKRYQKAKKKGKGEILDELLENINYNRDYGTLLLRAKNQPMKTF